MIDSNAPRYPRTISFPINDVYPPGSITHHLAVLVEATALFYIQESLDHLPRGPAVARWVSSQALSETCMSALPCLVGSPALGSTSLCHLSQPPWPQMNTLHFPVSVLGIAVSVEPSAAFYRSLSVRSDGPTILARPRLAVPRMWDFTD